MVSVGAKTREIARLFESGVNIEEIASIHGITSSGVIKRLRSFKKMQLGAPGPKNTNNALFDNGDDIFTWSLENIKIGFDKFIETNGRLPSADEVDMISYLPSSRQIQRRFGGLRTLRAQLGYEDVDFASGANRSNIQKSSRVRANQAEREFYKWLVNRFGEPFVHAEKEYGDIRNRADFLVFAKNLTVGIDVFATITIRTLRKNVDIKAKKYTSFPNRLPLLFVVWGEEFNQGDINQVCKTHLTRLPNLRVVTARVAYEKLSKIEPLEIPEGFVPMIKLK